MNGSTTTAPADTAARRGLWRSRWAAIGAAVAVSLGASGLYVAQATPGPDESTVVNVTPERILDTRDPNNVGLDGPFVSAVSQKLQVTGSIPTATGPKTVVPTGATGVLLNVTPVGSSADGFISIRPGDATGAPSTSSLNFTAGSILPNAVQVPVPTAGADAGTIDITFDAYGAAGPTTDILIDIVGYTTNTGLQQLVADVDSKASPTLFTRLNYSDQTTTTPGLGFEKVRDVGNFSKASAETGVKLTWQSHVTMTGGTSCTWQIRVDGLNGVGTTDFTGTQAITNSTDRESLSVVDVFSGLATGTHTVSIWVRGAGGPTCVDNSGNFERSVLVEEISMTAAPAPLTTGTSSATNDD